jgi:hypothetical protein
MVSSRMLRRVALVRTDVSEEPSVSFIRVTRIGELGTTLAATSNRRTLRRNTLHYSDIYAIGGCTLQRLVFKTGGYDGPRAGLDVVETR